MEEHDPTSILARARYDEACGALEAAAAAYEALAGSSQHDGALEELLRNVRRKLRVSGQIQALLTQGHRQIEAGEFPEAVQTFDAAVTLAQSEEVRRGYNEAARGAALALSLERGRVAALELLRQVAQEAPQTRAGLLRAFESALEALPEHPAALPTREALERSRDQIERTRLSDRERVDRAQLAIKAADFQQARRLLDSIEPTSPLRDLVDFNLSYVRKALEDEIEPALRVADTAITAGDWPDAQKKLDAVSAVYRVNPAIRRRLETIRLESAAEHTERAEEALLQRDPAAARAYCALAQQTLAPLVQRDQPLPVARQLDERLADISAITAEVERAAASLARVAEGQDAERSQTVFALNTALARADRAAGEGRFYPFISYALAVWRDDLVDTIGRVVGQVQHLQEAQRLIEAGRLARAERLLAGLEWAVRHQDRQEVAALRQQIEERQQHFAQLMARAAESAEQPEASAELYDEAYKLWPEGPEAAAALERSLVRAGERALEANDETRALAYFDRALALNPDSVVARSGRARPERRQRLDAQLAAIAASIEALHQEAATLPGDYEPLLERLQNVIGEAYDLDDQRRLADELQGRALERQASRRSFVERRAAAEALRRSGDWAASVEALRLAIAALEPPPAGALAELDQWAEVAAAMASTEEQGARLLAEAGGRYEGTVSAADLAAVRGLLGELDTLVRQTLALSDRARGNISPALQRIYADSAALTRRVEAIQNILIAPGPEQGLAAVQSVTERLGDDPLLQRLRGRFAAELQQRAMALVEEADRAYQGDRLAEAIKLLQAARGLDAQGVDVGRRLALIDERQALEAQLHAAEQESLTTASSVMSARDALRRGIAQFLEPASDLPPGLQSDLRDLLELGNPAIRSDLHRSEVWAEAQRLRARVIGLDHWAARRLAEPLGRWLNFARDAAARGYIATLTSLGQALDAYAEAYTYRQAYPENDASLEYLGDAVRALRAALSDFASKQLSRARELLERGEPAVALENVERLFTEYYGPIGEQFRGLLERMDETGELVRQRDEASLLRQRAADLARRAHDANALLAEAQEHYVQNRYDDVDRTLLALGALDELPAQQERAARLAATNAQARRELAERIFTSKLLALESSLSRSSSAEALAAARAELDQLRATGEWPLIGPEARARYEQLWSQARERSDLFSSAQLALADARLAQSAGEYGRAQILYQQALDTLSALDDAIGHARAQQDLEDLQAAVALLDRFEQAMARGALEMERGEFDRASEQFLTASSLGERLSIGPAREQRLLQCLGAARAGVRLRQARELWERGVGIERGIDLLALARKQLADPGPFRDLSDEITYYEERLRERSLVLQAELDRARDAIQRGDLAGARRHVSAAQLIDRESRSAEHLAHDVTSLEQTRARELQLAHLLRQIDQQRRRGNNARALDLIDRLLAIDPNHSTAQALRVEIEASAAGGEQFQTVQQPLFAGKFHLARRTLAQLSTTLSEEQIGELRRMIEEQEASYRSNTITPIRELLRIGRFLDALRKVNLELAHEREKSAHEREYLSDPIRAELEQLAVTISQRACNWAQAQLQQGSERGLPEIYLLLADRLRPLVAEPDLPEREVLARYLRQAEMAALQARLGLVEARLQLLTSPEPSPPGQLSPERLAAAPASAEEAHHEALEVALAAEALARTTGRNLGAIRQRAVALAAEARRLHDAEEDRQRAARYAARLSGSRESLDRARAEADPAAAARFLRYARESFETAQIEARTEGMLVRSPELGQAYAELAADLKAAEAQSERLARAIEQSRQAVLIGNLEHAAALLAPDGDWTPLQATHLQLRRQVALLRRAERAQSGPEPAWDEALAAYDEALALATGLELARVYAPRLGHCREHFVGQLAAEVEAWLHDDDLEAARSRLAQAAARGWLPPDDERVAHLRQRLAARARLADAQALLAGGDDPAAALAALREARQGETESAFVAGLAAWEQLALAALAARQDDPEGALTRLDSLPAAVTAIPAARQLRARLDGALADKLVADARGALESYEPDRAARALEQAAQRGLADDRLAGLRHDLAQQREAVAGADHLLAVAARHADGQEWEQAAAAMALARGRAPGYPRLTSNGAELLRRLVEAARAALDWQQYSRVAELSAVGPQLGGSAELVQIADMAAQRRREDLRRETEAFQRALAAGASDKADRHLSAIADLADNPSALAQLRHQRDQLAGQLEQQCAALEAGWQILARLEGLAPEADPAELFQAARGHFAGAEDLLEARRWSAYSSAMLEAVQLVNQARFAPLPTTDSLYEQACERLTRAAAHLRTPIDEAPHQLLGGRERLSNLRQGYALHAGSLGEQSSRIVELLRALHVQEQQDKDSETLATLDELERRLTQFQRSCRTLAVTADGPEQRDAAG